MLLSLVAVLADWESRDLREGPAWNVLPWVRLPDQHCLLEDLRKMEPHRNKAAPHRRSAQSATRFPDTSVNLVVVMGLAVPAGALLSELQGEILVVLLLQGLLI